MTLRWQLLLVSLLTLVLPWAGFQYVQELETVLRKSEERTLEHQARLLAQRLAERDRPLSGPDRAEGEQSFPAHDLPAPLLPAAPELDGYPGDWPRTPWTTPWDASARQTTTFLAGRHDGYLYLYVQAEGRSEDLDLVLSLEDDRGRLKRFRFPPAPPGITSPGRLESSAAVEWRIQANRQESTRQAHLEIRLPLDMVSGRLGFLVRDAGGTPRAGTLARPDMRPGLLVYGSADLEGLLERYVEPGQRALLADSNGWVLAQAGEAGPGAAALASHSLNARLYRLALDRTYPEHELDPGALTRIREPLGQAAPAGVSSRLYALPESDRLVLVTTVPVAPDGVLVLEKVTTRVLTLADQALSRLVAVSLLAGLLAAAGLLAYATILSVRIGRLRDAAEQARKHGGHLEQPLPGTASGDELGDLARSFQELLAELNEQTRYLQNLGNTLAHELRTPMTVVKSSLDNLEHEALPDTARPYLRRAEEGADRLRRILAALGEAARIEQGLGQGEHEALDLDALVSALAGGYRDAFPGRRFTYHGPGGPARVLGAPDLLAQALDKLVENAVEFSPEGGLIEIRLEPVAGRWRLRVANEGPRLARDARPRLFDSLVSHRQARDGGVHLGLGLHIVKLVAEHHGGGVSAGDSARLSGAEFTLELPALRD